MCIRDSINAEYMGLLNMMLSKADKHRLILQFNEERDTHGVKQKPEDYDPEVEEKEREDFENKDLTQGFDRLHLSKKLGEERKNRDLKETVRHTLRENPETHLSPALWSQINGNYILPAFKKTESEFKASFCKGETLQDTNDRYLGNHNRISCTSERPTSCQNMEKPTSRIRLSFREDK
eukprot:TRINITY_DN499_c0_g2_i1.p1 TRINITY_DN499_c0_g2~~TRINITY_DN499_c0_g2_i1.p1  ORF type:complete len:179 (-),score=34.24 TRINITY_DN499_c0_g2_i1:183-719(-)